MVRGEEEELLRVAHKLHLPPLLLDMHGGEEEEVRSELSMTSPRQWRTTTRCWASRLTGNEWREVSEVCNLA
jgi:hypothetical protein